MDSYGKTRINFSRNATSYLENECPTLKTSDLPWQVYVKNLNEMLNAFFLSNMKYEHDYMANECYIWKDF